MFSRTSNNMVSRWWWTVDRPLLGAVSLLIAVGLVLVMAASPAVAEHIGLPSFHFVIRQVIFVMLGFGLMMVTSMLPNVVVRRLAVLAFFGSLLLLFMVLFVGFEAKGARRWIPLIGFTLQPSEFIKPFFAVITAWMLARAKMQPGFPGFRIAFVLYALICALLILQPDFGMTIAVSIIWGAQVFIAGLSWWWILLILFGGALGAFFAYSMLPHVAQRINTFLDPASGDNYQSDKALEAFIGGGFMGRGPGEGQVKHIIPDAHTDFIFAVAGEEFGIIVLLLIMLLYAFIIFRAMRCILKENDLFLIYATSGLLTLFAMQTLVNMGVSLSLLPNTGMTLPFISYGGSSTIAMSLAMGMILAFTRKRYGEKK